MSRISVTSSGIVTLLIAATMLAADSNEMGKWNSSDPTYVPFPVYSFVVSPDNRFVGMKVDEHPEKHLASIPAAANWQTIYLLDLETGNHRNLGPGDGDLIPGPKDHKFIYLRNSGTSDDAFILFDGLEPTKKLQVGQHSGAWWNSFTNEVMFAAGWPGNQEGFNKVGFLETTTGRVNRTPLRAVTELMGVCRTTGHFFTEHWNPESQEYSADEYDSHGNFLRGMGEPLAFYSAGCGYVLPFFAESPHGPEDWAVYEASTNKLLMSFPWDDSGKIDTHLFPEWNPRHDELLLVYTQHARTNNATMDVVDVRKRKFVKRWPDRHAAPVVWAGDGKSVVTVRNHRFVFDPI